MESQNTWSATVIGNWIDSYVAQLPFEYVAVSLGASSEHVQIFKEIVDRRIGVSCHALGQTPYQHPPVIAYIFPVLSQIIGREVKQAFYDIAGLEYLRFYQGKEAVAALSKQKILPAQVKNV